MMTTAQEKQKLFIFRPTMGQGGADRVTATLLRHLARDEYDLTLVLIRKEGEYLEDIPGDTRVISLKSRSLWTAWWPSARLLREQRPDIILSTSSGTNISASLAHGLARQRSRLVLSERNVLEHGGLTIKRRLVILLKRLLYNRADLLTTISDCLKVDLVASLNVDPAKVFVVYNPVVEDSISVQAEEPVGHPWFQEDVPVILGVGRLVPQKDFATLLRAFQLVRSQQQARLVILGEGPKREELEALAAELGVMEDLWMPGFDKNPFRYMARCTIFVQCPIHEGLGNVLIQAMHCGAPAISTDCPCGPAEIITEPGADGTLVPVRDHQALADRIIYLLDRPELRRQMGEQGRVSAERFRAETIVKRYEAAISGDLSPYEHEQSL